MDAVQLVAQFYKVVIAVVVCVAVVVIVRMLLDHKERSDRRRDDMFNTPLERFSDHDEAERLASKYEQVPNNPQQSCNCQASHQHARGIPQINITIGGRSVTSRRFSSGYDNAGARFSASQTVPRYGVSRRSLPVTFVLCLVLGYFGAHYVYCGRMGMAVLYFLTGGLFGIGWVIDLIRIGTGNFVDNTGCYVTW